jgi:hypothetical protein
VDCTTVTSDGRPETVASTAPLLLRFEILFPNCAHLPARASPKVVHQTRAASSKRLKFAVGLGNDTVTVRTEFSLGTVDAASHHTVTVQWKTTAVSREDLCSPFYARFRQCVRPLLKPSPARLWFLIVGPRDFGISWSSDLNHSQVTLKPPNYLPGLKRSGIRISGTEVFQHHQGFGRAEIFNLQSFLRGSGCNEQFILGHLPEVYE